MRKHLESIQLDIPPVISNREMDGYIKLQLLAFFPEPDLLIYDYVLTGKQQNRSVLLTYMLKEDYNPKDTILHPHLLVKHRIWRDGSYHIKWDNRELLIQMKAGRVTLAESDPQEIEELGLEDITTINQQELDKLYRRCKRDMFKRKRSLFSIPQLITLLSILTLSLYLYNAIGEMMDNRKTLDRLEKSYEKLLTTKNSESEEDKLYNTALEEVLKMESHITPSIYLLLTQLLDTKTRVIIKDFSYDGSRISLTLLTTNSLQLLKELNNSPYLKMTLNSTVPGKDMELSQFNGEVLCP